MIITKQKSFENILNYIADESSIFIFGCGDCATLCRTGGEEEIKEMSEKIKKIGKKVTGIAIANAPCHELDTARIFRKYKEQISQSDGILVLACGAGVQAAREATEKKVHPGCDSLFIGNSKRHMNFYEKCSACGDCVLDEFGGICPVTRCPKSLLNGPCCGSLDGKCEINQTVECVWIKIFERLKLEGRLSTLDTIHSPKNHSDTIHPGKIE
jgi:ferredoxin